MDCLRKRTERDLDCSRMRKTACSIRARQPPLKPYGASAKSPLLFTFCLLAFPQLKPIPGACSSDASKNPKTRRT